VEENGGGECGATFVRGPATATSAMSRPGWFKRPNATGTGFAQPNRKGAEVMKSRAGTMIVPNRSTCFRGLKVTRPSRWAVSSPSFQAEYAWAASWNVMAIRIGMAHVEALYRNSLTSKADHSRSTQWQI
jgi:hypothetical protein